MRSPTRMVTWVRDVRNLCGNGDNFAAQSDAKRPTYRTNPGGSNGRPAFLFNGDDEFQSLQDGNATDDLTVYLVFRRPAFAALNVAFQHAGRNTLGFDTQGNYSNFVGGKNNASNVTAPVNTWSLHAMTVDHVGSTIRFYENASEIATTTLSKETRSSKTWIGGNGTGGGTPFRGEIAEVLKYNRLLNSLERIFIDNYLSAKYGLTLAANKLFGYDDAAGGEYDFDVTGIGQNNSGVRSARGRGRGSVEVSNPSNLSNNKFLFWGHDGKVRRADNRTDVPAGVNARFERTWRCSEVNAGRTAVDVGTVDISWDLSDLGFVVAEDLRLLVTGSNSSIFSGAQVISGAINVGGGIFRFANVSALVNGSRFTLGTANQSQTALPVTWVNFRAALLGEERVELEWETVREADNAYFTVQRSRESEMWIDLERVPGAVTTLERQAYRTVDRLPGSGTFYYRIKQTDLDGTTDYSAIETVTNRAATGDLRVFPNPASGRLTLTGLQQTAAEIRVLDLLGRNQTDRVISIGESEYGRELDVSGLPSGAYWITDGASTVRFQRQ